MGRHARSITHEGETKVTHEWAEFFGITQNHFNILLKTKGIEEIYRRHHARGIGRKERGASQGFVTLYIGGMRRFKKFYRNSEERKKIMDASTDNLRLMDISEECYFELTHT